MHGGLYDLLAQMGGRKALAGPGIMSYLVHFYNARLFVVNVLILIVALVMRYRLLPVETIRSETFKVHGLLTLSYGAIIVLGAVILLGNQDYHAVPFEIFFILSIYSVWTFLNSPISVRELSVSFFALAISWSASISGGMNSPLLGTGYLATAFFATAYFSFRTTESAKMQYTKYGGIIKIIPVAFSIVLLLFSAYGQRKFNYRDKPATALGSHLGEISHEKFGSIRTNRTTYEYLLSVKEVLEEHPEMKDRSVFLPNHCALYPVFNTRNPFPLEWNDRWEYLGLESDYHKRCRLALAKGPVYLFVDKINAEKMADSLTDMHYDEWLHENIVSFLKLSEKMDIKNNFFDVHVMTQ
jgi:hypothetical protein